MSCAWDSALIDLCLLFRDCFCLLLARPPLFFARFYTTAPSGCAVGRCLGFQAPCRALLCNDVCFLVACQDFFAEGFLVRGMRVCACWLGLACWGCFFCFFLFFFYRGERTNTHRHNQPVFPLSLLIVVYMGCTMRNVFSPGRAPACGAPLAQLHSLTPSCDMVCGVSCLCSRLGLLGLSCGCFLNAWLCPVCEDIILSRLRLLLGGSVGGG